MRIKREERAPILLTRVKTSRRSTREEAAHRVTGNAKRRHEEQPHILLTRVKPVRESLASRLNRTGEGPATEHSVSGAPQTFAASRFRSWPLWPQLVQITFNSPHNFFAGFKRELSSAGIFVSTYLAMAIDDPMLVTFTVPGIERISLAACRVVWVREFNERTMETLPGVGLRFHDLDAETGMAVIKFMRFREPIFWEG